VARIVIQGVKPYDGEYEFDAERALNAREWRWIKKISGYLPVTIEDGFTGRDPDLFVALAAIAMCRDGKIDKDAGLRVADELAEAPFDGTTITLVGDEIEEDDESPPVLTSEPDESSPSGSLEKQSSSGEPSRNDSVTSDETPSATTALRSVTSSESNQTELAS
jgi:hypothetical protein